MPRIKVVTINLLTDLSRWKGRRPLLVSGLAELAPDLIAVQEVSLPEDTAQWLADQLDFPHVHLSPKTGFEKTREAIAILSRIPFEHKETLDLGGQQRVAQAVQVRISNQPILLANGHLYWQPGESEARNRQVERLLQWLRVIAHDNPAIVCGDFNGTPETQAVQHMRQYYSSAYAAIHRQEPEYTCPTSLPRSPWSQLRTLLGFFVLIRPKHFNLRWRGTLDYIFVDPKIQVLDCQIVLNQPLPHDSRIYPSDHFGLCATLHIGEQ